MSNYYNKNKAKKTVVRKKVPSRPTEVKRPVDTTHKLMKKYGRKAVLDTAGEYGSHAGALMGTKSVRAATIIKKHGLKPYLKSEEGVDDLVRKKRKAAHDKIIKAIRKKK